MPETLPENLDVIPAATLVVMRDNPSGPPELLMVERSSAMRFAGGAVVFPGGRIDAGDRAFAAALSGDVDDNAARIAAIRETIEEAGLAIAIDVAGPAIAELRRALYAGEPIAASLAAAGAILAPDRLVPFARWRPPEGFDNRVFDTRFYLARARADAPEPQVDGGENVHAYWATAQAVLDQADAGRVRILFPTRRNLERLARFACWDEAIEDALAHPVETISPEFAERDGVRYLCIPEGRGYPVTSQRMDQAIRA